MKQLLIALALLCVSAPSWAATCKISEYSSISVDASGREVPVALEPANAVQQVTYTTTTQSTACNSATRFVRIVCDAKAHFEFGSNPTATATDPFVAADSPEYFAVRPGATNEVAFYDGTT
jgi:hypothetical protein